MSSTIGIGIDVGSSQVKAGKSCFDSGVQPLSTPAPIKRQIIDFNGVEYATGIPKTGIDLLRYDTRDNSFLVAHLRAIAESMKDVTEADIRLGVGTPLTRVGAERKKYEEYLLRNNQLSFSWEGRPYQINLVSVDVFPQAHAAIASRLNEYANSVIVDIGGWTIDILPIIDGNTDIVNCRSLNLGLLTCYSTINEHIRQEHGWGITPNLFRDYILGKASCNEYAELLNKDIATYIDMIYNQLTTLGYNMDLTHFVFMGGGAALLRDHRSSKYDYDHEYICDICANAQGYEALLKHKYEDIS